MSLFDFILDSGIVFKFTKRNILFMFIEYLAVLLSHTCICGQLAVTVNALEEKQFHSRETMKAVAYTTGGPEGLFISDVPIPQPAEMEVRIRIFATAINRADTLQRKGLYNPPHGASTILGLEASGVIDQVGPGCPGNITTGQRVMALLSGGGNAEYVTCRYEQVILVPDGVTLTQAAAIPEVWLTAFQLLYTIGKLSSTDTVLIHAGGSGVGTAAIQLVKQAGATSIVTAGSQEKIDFAKSLGAKEGINYKEPNWSKKVLDATNGQGVDLVLDCVGGSHFADNVIAIKTDGRWVIYGLMGGSNLNVNLNHLMAKRIDLHFTTLRSRSIQYKQMLVRDFSNLALPLFGNGTFKPIIHTVFPLADIAMAHKLMESNKNMGKILLKVADENVQGKQEL